MRVYFPGKEGSEQASLPGRSAILQNITALEEPPCGLTEMSRALPAEERELTPGVRGN